MRRAIRKTRRPRRAGLTLIELVVAMAITGMLMTGALVAVGNLARSERRIEAAEPATSPAAGLDVILTADLLHASEYNADAKGKLLAIRTRTSLAGSDMELEHIGSAVRYEVRRIDDRPWLIRTQQTGIDQSLAELVCSDVESIRLRDSSAKAAMVGPLWKEMPYRATVMIGVAGGETQTFVVRRR